MEDVKTLDEVVVVGYGSQKRTNLTGAISTVTSQELVDRPASSVTHMLQGRVPGLNITTSSGVPVILQALISVVRTQSTEAHHWC